MSRPMDNPGRGVEHLPRQRCDGLFHQASMNPITLGAVLILMSALAKALGASMEHVLLGQPLREFDVITYRQVLLAASIIEVAVGIFLLSGRSRVGHARILTALVASFWAYRVAALAAGIEGPCPCLGNMWHWASVSAETVNRLGWGLIVALTVCAVMSLRQAHTEMFASGGTGSLDQAGSQKPQSK